MKLYYSMHSPFVRKVLVVAEECGLAGRIELLPQSANPVHRNREIVAHNPLGQVPTLFDDDGRMLADSRVICEYLDHTAQAGLFPLDPASRWRALTEQALADGLLNAALACRYEALVRPEEKRWSVWVTGQMEKIGSVLDHAEKAAAGLRERTDIGTLTLACALSYLDHRFPDLPWRDRHPSLAKWYEQMALRPSMQATRLGVDRRP